MTFPSAEKARLLGPLLKSVSRAFYLSIRVLPGPLREPVGLAYLLARAADTIADAGDWSSEERRGLLAGFRRRLESPASVDFPLNGLPDRLSPAEKRLLQAHPALFAFLDALSPADRALVGFVVSTLSRGMEIDITLLAEAFPGRPAAMRTVDELDRYLYLMAGCVGEFWTKAAAAHLPALEGWITPDRLEQGVRLGKALQLVNILRDAPQDLRRGRCYLPIADLDRVELSPSDLLDATASERAWPVLAWWIATGLGHFEKGRDYLAALPWRCLRLRLAVAWPLLMGLATLARVADRAAWLDPARRAKVSRAWVYRMIALSVPAALVPRAMDRLIRELRREVLERLAA